jgi:hypothetical protein
MPSTLFMIDPICANVGYVEEVKAGTWSKLATSVAFV